MLPNYIPKNGLSGRFYVRYMLQEFLKFIQKNSISVIHHFNRLKKKNHDNFNRCRKTDKIQNPFVSFSKFLTYYGYMGT